MNKDRLVTVTFMVRIPEEATDEEIMEWLRFELNDNYSMQSINPLSGSELEPLQGSLEWI